MAAFRSMPSLSAVTNLSVVTILSLTACGDPSGPLPQDGSPVLEGGILQVQGDAGPNEIRITHSASGVDVERDGEVARFTERVVAVEVSSGEGSDIVRYEQTVVADVALTIDTGAGDDDVLVSFAPAGPGTESTVPIVVRTGPGSDRLDFRWDGSAAPSLNPHLTLEAQSESLTPEQEDEVLVAFEGGEPARPIVIGGLWNGRGPEGSTAGGDSRSLSLEFDFGAERADVSIAITGGDGPDEVELEADYSGVTLQQGRITLDADLNEGDNSLGKYVITSAKHTDVDIDVVAGHGNNVLDLETVLGGDGAKVYQVEVGDGDNETTIRFGDGARGRRPTTGQRNVTATYRSGSGANAVDVESEIVEPLASELVLDYGSGQGTTTGRYKVKFPWDRAEERGTQVVPSQVKVLLLSPNESALDLRIDVGDPELDDPDQFGVVTASGTALGETDLEFLHRLVTPAGATEVEDEWELRVGGLATTADASLGVQVPPGLERLVYLQDAVEVAGGANMKVALQGGAADDAVLAHMIGVTGGGHFDLLADGGAGDDLLAVMTRDLDGAGGAEMAFTLSGGDGTDVLGLARPAGIEPGTPFVHVVAGGAGSDACFTSQDVAATECERLEAIGEELLTLLESEFGAELAEVWKP